MSVFKHLRVAELSLDLDNYRTVHQKNETHAINTMIAIRPDRFWALMESILEDGYYPTENIIVLNDGTKNVVKEGNRRIGVLKIIYGLAKGIDVPVSIKEKIKTVTEEWTIANTAVPCSLYRKSEARTVDRIVSLVHAKGEKAGRDQWTAVARARYNRDQKSETEPSLDLLELYLKHGNNITNEQAERWSGDFPLSVLDEALQKIYPHLGFQSISQVVASYPNKKKRIVDMLVSEVGLQIIGFKDIRDKVTFLARYGIDFDDESPIKSTGEVTQEYAGIANARINGATTATGSRPRAKPKAQMLNEPRAVYKKLRAFWPRGNGREKVATLLTELKKLKIDQHPHAFCFLLRSMFEISAKAYCADHKGTGGPSHRKTDGNDKSLADLLREITQHMTSKGKDKENTKVLHGAMAELGKTQGLLSVTSMNQLVHNSTFSIAANDICILFFNVFPLLDQMNI